MAKGQLRQALDDAIRDNPITDWLDEYGERVNARSIEASEILNKLLREKPLQMLPLLFICTVRMFIYILTGIRLILDAVLFFVGVEYTPNTSAYIAEILRNAIADPRIKELTEVFGALITEPVLTLFESYAGQDEKDPHEFSRAFHGFMISLNLAKGITDVTVETATAGQVEGAGKMMESMYWSLGLGFLGWQTLAPLLSAGLQPSLERYYNKLYRPLRFNASDMRDLYALGRMTRDDLYEGARKLGWRDQDIEHWLALAFRNLSEGDVFDLLEKKLITQEEAIRRLAVLGFDPKDIPLLFKLHPTADVSDAITVTLSTARASFREGLIGEDEFRNILRSLKRGEREEDLLASLERQKQETDVRSLTIGQLHSAWDENVITDSEAAFWLKEEQLDPTSIEIILRTWKAQIAPKFRKLNVNTITAAYVEGMVFTFS